MSNYKACVLTNEKTFEFAEKEIRKPQGKQVLVKVAYCAICTLEQRVYKGVMKKYPFAGGHEVSGTVEAVGEDVKSVKAGDKVAVRMLTSCGECYYCRNGHENQCVISFKASAHEGLMGPGGFSEYMMVDSKSVYPLPEDTDLQYAALSEPLACCVHSVNNAQIELGNDVVVIGAGIMGAMHIQLAKLRGARVIVCEVDEKRLQIARELGADITINSKEIDAVQKVKDLTDGRGADVVFCTAAISKLAADSIAMAGKNGRVVMYSSFHPDNPIDLSANRVHSSEMIITGAVNPKASDFLTATRLLSFHLIDVSKLISDVIPLEKIGEAFEKAIDPSTYRIVLKCH
ncbi:MAG: Putative chlorophyll synthesis pathway protein BchC [Eubacteriales bacterium]|jgi:2-desacetyl-2-hydroxyethyl bacteriochlorophyllide A dehydrogenase